MRDRPRRSRSLFLGVLALVVIVGCGARLDRSSKNQDDAKAPASAPAEGMLDKESAGNALAMRSAAFGPADALAATPPASTRIDRRVLIRDASIALVVSSVDSTAALIERLVVARGGFVGNAQRSNPDGFSRANYALRIPSDRLDDLLRELRGLAVRVESETVQTQDATDQVVDSEARLRTLRATEVELVALLHEARERSRKVSEVMAVYQELTGIRTQIEQLDGQRSILLERAALSTLSVQLIPDAAVGPVQPQGWRPSETVKTSLRQLVGTMSGLADIAIWAAIVLLPLGLLIAAAAAVAVLGVRRLAFVKRLRATTPAV